jgi:hypothetical protein
MATKQVWDDKVHLVLGDVVYTHLYVYVDPAKVQGEDLATAFTFQADVRAAGADLWSTGSVPLKNGPISATPTASVATLGAVGGEIDDWGFTGASWSAATAVNFLVVAKADVSLPLSLLPGVIGTVVGLFGSKIRVTVGHENVLLSIQRDPTGKVVSINHIAVP